MTQAAKGESKVLLGNVETAYLDVGRGEPVVLLHGFPLNRDMWQAQVAALSPRFRVIAPDFRGHGGSSVLSPVAAADGDVHHMETLAEDVRGLLDHLRLEQVSLVGFSMGGYVAFAFYRRYRARVKALVLADTRPQADSPEARQGREATVRTALKEGTSAVAQTLAGRMLAPETLQGRPQLAEQVRGMMTSTPLIGWMGDLRGLARRSDSTATLAIITCPTLILVGQKDALTPPADSQLMAQHIKGAKLVEVPSAGHLAPLEQPEAFNKALLEFLDSVLQPTRAPQRHRRARR
ncbi:MAG: alpha/beta fold hydrolase [Chloroflexi bacterium]|nr:alpha/beta fold hydrolase [Chloroflexota bacterium]